MVRSLRVIWLFTQLLCSYGAGWALSRVLGERAEERWELVHQKNAARVAERFMSLRGIFIKLGQVLSVLGGFLPRAYGLALSQLQDEVPPRPFSEMKPRLLEALGPAALSQFESFAELPIAAASLAQVHEAKTRDGRRVAVKLLYPGIRGLIQRDLATIRFLLPVIRRLVLISRIDRVLEQLESMLGRETDYDNERKNIARMRVVFSDMPRVVIPEVIAELSGQSVLTMSFEEGKKITDRAGLEALEVAPKEIASLVVECYFRMLFSARIFHADPHPGNFLVRREGMDIRLVILDHGAVEEVTPALASGMQQVVLGALTRSDDQILLGLETMGFVAPGGDRDLLAGVAKEYLSVLAKVRIKDFSKLDQDAVTKLAGFDQIRGRLRELMRHIEYPEGYFYVERTLVLLFGLVGQLAPREGLPGLVAPFANQAFLALATPVAPPAPQ